MSSKWQIVSWFCDSLVCVWTVSLSEHKGPKWSGDQSAKIGQYTTTCN